MRGFQGGPELGYHDAEIRESPGQLCSLGLLLFFQAGNLASSETARGSSGIRAKMNGFRKQWCLWVFAFVPPDGGNFLKIDS